MSKKARRDLQEVNCSICRRHVAFGTGKVVCIYCHHSTATPSTLRRTYLRWPVFNPENVQGVIARDSNFKFCFEVAPPNQLLAVVDDKVTTPEHFRECSGGHEFISLEGVKDSNRVARLYEENDDYYLYIQHRPESKFA